MMPSEGERALQGIRFWAFSALCFMPHGGVIYACQRRVKASRRKPESVRFP
jgi:hypothetical protein